MMTTNKMQPPVIATLCHIRMIPRVAIFWRVISKKAAAMPVPSPKPITPSGKCLQQHHAGQPPVGDADGLQSAELLQVFQRNK